MTIRTLARFVLANLVPASVAMAHTGPHHPEDPTRFGLHLLSEHGAITVPLALLVVFGVGILVKRRVGSARNR